MSRVSRAWKLFLAIFLTLESAHALPPSALLQNSLAIPMRSSLAGEWLFSDGEKDFSGRGLNGTLYETAALVEGFYENLATNPARMEIPVADELNGSTGDVYTISAWLRTTNDVAEQIIFSKTAATNSYLSFRVSVGPTTVSYDDELVTVTFNSDVNGHFCWTAYRQTNRAELLDGAWHHIAVVGAGYGGGTKIYVDGIEKTNTQSYCQAPPYYGNWYMPGPEKIMWGARRYQGQYERPFRGDLDGLRVDLRALTADEIRVLSNRRR